MFSSVIALAAAVAAMQSDPVNNARQAYNTCLRSYMRAQLEQHTEPAAFETALPTQCNDRGAAFTAALVQRDSRAGGGRARAEEDARMTMEDMRATTVEYYADYHASNSLPPH
jgi:hypothetical protein